MSIADARCNHVRFPDVFHFLGLLLSVEVKLNSKKFRTFYIASANRAFHHVVGEGALRDEPKQRLRRRLGFPWPKTSLPFTQAN